MAAFVVGLLVILAMASHSVANYCVCNSGLSDSVLQKNIDYACGNGADCSAILQNGPCFNPNTVKDHCNYAVNSYYQRKGQIPGSCDFQGTATVSPSAPSAGSGCVFQSGPSTGGSTTPSTSPTNPTTPTTPTPPSAGGTVGGTPTTPTTPTTGTPPNAGGTVGGTPNTGGTTVGGAPNAGSTTPGTFPGSTVPPTIGLGPSGSAFGNTDGSGSVKLSSQSSISFMLVSFSLCVLIPSLVL